MTETRRLLKHIQPSPHSALLLALFICLHAPASLACRPPPFFTENYKTEIRNAALVAVGFVVSVSHESYEKEVIQTKNLILPKISIETYSLKIAFSDAIKGNAGDTITLEAGGCWPPLSPGDKVIVIEHDTGKKSVTKASDERLRAIKETLIEPISN